MTGEAGGNARCPVVGFDGAGYQYVSISVEGERSTSVGVTPVVAITSNDKLPEGVNQHFVQCFDVFDARLWQVAVFPLHLLELIPTLVVGGLVQRFPLIPSLEATNIAMLGGLDLFFFGLKEGFLFVGAAMNLSELHLHFALSEPFQKTLPLIQWANTVVVTELDDRVVIGGILQPLYRGCLLHSYFARFKLVLFRRVVSSLIQQFLITQPYIHALASPFIGLDDNINHAGCSDQYAADCNNGSLLNKNSPKGATASKQIYEFECVSHLMKQLFLKKQVTNGVLRFCSGFIRHFWPLIIIVCAQDEALLIAVVIIPIIWVIVIIRHMGRRFGRHTDRRVERVLFRWVPAVNGEGNKRIHSASPLQNVSNCDYCISLGSLTSYCPSFLRQARHDRRTRIPRCLDPR